MWVPKALNYPYRIVECYESHFAIRSIGKPAEGSFMIYDRRLMHQQGSIMRRPLHLERVEYRYGRGISLGQYLRYGGYKPARQQNYISAKPGFMHMQ